MAVKIRLLRMGKIRNPQYRIVVADSRTKRDGRAIEFVGIYQPKEDPSVIEVKSDRVQYWLSVGAQPSEAVQRLLEKTGDWQKFKGLPAPPPRPLRPRTPASRPDMALRPALEHLVKGIVDNPDDVRVRMVDSRRGKRLEVRVHPEDLGTVIGRSGRTAKALRQVVGSIGGRGVRVDIVDSY